MSPIVVFIFIAIVLFVLYLEHSKSFGKYSIYISILFGMITGYGFHHISMLPDTVTVKGIWIVLTLISLLITLFTIIVAINYKIGSKNV